MFEHRLWALISILATLFALSCGQPTIEGRAAGRGAGGAGGTAGASAGGMGPLCSSTQLLCNGLCTDTSSAAQNCGTCGVTCQIGETCSSGMCQCLPGLTDCAGTCANTQSDGLHCGPSCAACGTGQVCSLGSCKAGCDDGLTQCGSSCVDLDTDVAHCGTCETSCPTGQSCGGGQCRCQGTQTRCEGVCVDSLTDPLNCGACGTQCEQGQTCAMGACSGGNGGSGNGGGGNGGSGNGGGGNGGSTTSGGAAGSAGGGNCTDIPPDDQYTCAQQVGWGKCNEPWMQGHCDASCGRCAGGTGGAAGTGGTGGAAGTGGGGAGSGGTAGNAGTGGGGSGGCSVQPANPNTNQTTKNVLCYLYDNYGENVLSGQQDCSWSNPGDIEYINSNTGKWPAIIGGDLLYNDAVSQATSYWNAGGLSMIRYHMGRPGEPDGYDQSLMDISDSEFAQALTPGTSLNDDLMSKFDKAANKLAQLQSAGVTVIYAPWHEIDPNSWFWWGKGTTDQFKQLWRLMYDDFTARGLNNLIWLFPYSGSPSAVFYPGAAYVDIAGGDTYGSGQPFSSLYNSVRNIAGTTMPLALHETGIIPNPGQMFPTQAPWVLFNVWCDTWLREDNSVSSLQTTYNHARTITRDELPNF